MHCICIVYALYMHCICTVYALYIYCNKEPVIASCYYFIRQYFRKACDVPDPEVHFNINQYTEAALVVKPRISISADDLINTHAKLLEYRAKIAPDSLDAIHELLEDLGSAAPTVEELMGSGRLFILIYITIWG